MSRFLAALLAAPCAFTPTLLAQQFVHQPGALPGASRWTEGVEAADVDQDGDLDLFFAEGEGFASAGAKRQNILIINQLVEVGPGTFADESVARLGSRSSNAKGVTTADVDGDGWVDALFANGFNTDIPFLYINRGAAQPGFFDMESSSRGLTEALSSASAQFGDLDDDGDLDLVLNDSGNSFLAGSGGKPRLYINDGSGNFTENPAGMPAPTKVAHMDVQLVDIDNDWDLDFVGANRASNSGGNHYLMLNDGTGQFTDASSQIPASSSSTYENEVGDLDADGDIDMFFVSLTGFREGAVRNNLVETGSLGFTSMPPLNGSVDDNEIVQIDFNNDGLLDVLVGSLGSQERIYRNQGALDFSLNANRITQIADSTLDATAADLDGDGAYDIITAQGESNVPQWANKLYLNTGDPDDVPPVLVGVNAPASPSAWPVVVKAKHRDQVLDDGISYVSGRVDWTAVDPVEQAVTHSSGAFSPATLVVGIGTRVVFTNSDGSAQSVTSVTDPYGFDLELAASGGSAEYVFVAPGTYDYVSSGSGAAGQIVVQGSPSTAELLYMGVGQQRAALPRPAVAQGDFALEVRLTDWNGNVTVSDSLVFAAPGACGAEAAFCSTSANSVGAGALMSTNGERSITANALELRADGCPAGQFGIFYYGATQVAGGAGAPFGDGLRCVGGAGQPIFRLPPIAVGGSGRLAFAVDFSGLPNGGDITAGSTWNFQAWYRDPAAGGTGFNLSDGLEISFCP